jgi:DNA-binding NarL/FixJ family response regulator
VTAALAVGAAELRSCVASGLEAPGFEVVLEDSDVQAVLEQLPELMPDVLVLEAGMERPDVAEVCRSLQGLVPTRTLVVGQAHDRALYEAIRAGAGGVLERPRVDQVAPAVKAVASGGCLLPRAVAALVLFELEALARRSSSLEPRPALTATEREVLGQLAAGDTADDIAEQRNVTPRLVHVQAGYAVTKLQRYLAEQRRLSLLL